MKRYLYKPAAIITALWVLIFLSSCSGSQKQGTVHIRVINGGVRSNHMGEKVTEKWAKNNPVTFNLKIDDKVLISKGSMELGKPVDLEQKLSPGQYSLQIEEPASGASQRTILPVNGNSWVRVTFYREGPRMGYFEVESRPQPWDSDSWNKKEKDSGDLMNDEEIDRRFDDLKKQTDSRKKPEKKPTEKPAGK